MIKRISHSACVNFFEKALYNLLIPALRFETETNKRSNKRQIYA